VCSKNRERENERGVEREGRKEKWEGWERKRTEKGE